MEHYCNTDGPVGGGCFLLSAVRRSSTFNVQVQILVDEELILTSCTSLEAVLPV